MNPNKIYPREGEKVKANLSYIMNGNLSKLLKQNNLNDE